MHRSRNDLVASREVNATDCVKASSSLHALALSFFMRPVCYRQTLLLTRQPGFLSASFRRITSTMAGADKPKPFMVRFYGPEAARDAEGRSLEDILQFKDSELEYHHDYIQVLFPLPEPSPINPGAPIIKYVSLARMLSLGCFSIVAAANTP